MTKNYLTIATRESPLALQQASLIKTELLKHFPDLSITFLGITTQADKMLDRPLMDIGGKGLFVKELEEALLAGHADIAVHSMKDVPMTLPPGLILPVIGKREDPRDVFVSDTYGSLAAMPKGARLGTSSLRRQSQMLALYPDLELVNLRGNIQTRLKRLDEGEYDAIILAGAGLKRMGLEMRIRAYLPETVSLPAAGQGALGIECREGDAASLKLISVLKDPTTQACVEAERAMCQFIGGGCHAPVAAFAEIEDGVLTLRGLVSSVEGKQRLRAQEQGQPEDAKQIGMQVAKTLIEQGALQILASIPVNK